MDIICNNAHRHRPGEAHWTSCSPPRCSSMTQFRRGLRPGESRINYFQLETISTLFERVHLFLKVDRLTNPPRNAPKGLRAGRTAASAYRRGAELWKLRAALVARLVVLSARAPDETNLDAMLAIVMKLQWRRWLSVVLGGISLFGELGRHS